MNDRIIRTKEFCYKMSVSRTTLWRMYNTDPNFPQKIKVTSRLVGWKESSVNQYIEQMARGQ